MFQLQGSSLPVKQHMNQKEEHSVFSWLQLSFFFQAQSQFFIQSTTKEILAKEVKT